MPMLAPQSASANLLTYCQFLLNSQINYTLTYLGEHTVGVSHDQMNNLLDGKEFPPSLIWENTKDDIIPDENAYIAIDDTVLDKRYSRKMDCVLRQYSGNAHQVIKGIGVVTCIYVNPALNQFWTLDHRIYLPKADKKTKHDHVKAMIKDVIDNKKLPFKKVLMDCWYSKTPLLLYLESMGKIYYCPIPCNRLTDESGGVEEYKRVDALEWTERDLEQGKLVKLSGFPRDYKVKLFRVIVSEGRTEYVITNDKTQSSGGQVRRECAVRWKIEEFHRELKQLTGIAKSQCRKERIQRNHIVAALLVWNRLKNLAYKLKITIYQLKKRLLDDYMIQQMLQPSIPMLLNGY
jgi:hypothetical protein